MKINRFFTNVFLLTFILLQSVLIENVNAQNAPPNTRLFQLNTAKGSALTLIESSDNYVYHVGTSNSSEIGIDGLQGNSVGIDDLFILKSDAITGANQWVKTYHAGSKGIITPRYAYIDSSENIFVYGQFSGTITAGATSISASATAPSFLMKINSSGNAVWVTSLSGSYNNTYQRIKCTNDGADVFLVYDKNHLARINESNGTLLYDKIYPEAELKSVLVSGSELFIGGTALNGFNEGTEVIDFRTGFILKGDKNANFNASAKIKQKGINNLSDISDIAFSSSDNTLIITGIKIGESLGLVSEGGTFNYTFNPNSYFTNREYNYVAKIDKNLDSVLFFNVSTKLANSDNTGSTPNKFQFYATIKAKDGSSNFRVILHGSIGSAVNNVVNANGSQTTLTPSNEPYDPYSVEKVNKQVLSFNAQGNYGGEMQKNTNDLICISSNNYTESKFKNQLIDSNSYSMESGALVWSKKKVSSVRGRIDSHNHKHLNSAKNQMFVTSLLSGKVDFYGKQINNSPGINSQSFTRLAEDGTPIWHAQLLPVRLYSDYPGGDQSYIGGDAGNYFVTDKQDNIIALTNSSGTFSTFVDSAGNITNFSQNASPSSKILIKLDKNGILLWSKQITGSAYLSVITDKEDNIYVYGSSANQNLTVDGTTVSGIFILKFSPAGNLLLSKSYPGDAFEIVCQFDDQNKLYMFMYHSTRLTFDAITIPSDIFDNFLMIKFDDSGNVIWGKNFSISGYTTDVEFDGTDFVVTGDFMQDSNGNFIGFDLVQIPNIYQMTNNLSYIAKVTTSGDLKWQKVLYFDSPFFYFTNLNVDSNKNIYLYLNARNSNKMNFNNTEYLLNASKYTPVLMKIDSFGVPTYIKLINNSVALSTKIDVIENDKINVSGFTWSHQYLNYPISYNSGSSNYIATFGNLDSYYLSPIKDYKLLTNFAISNNPNNENYFAFDLVNNVNWNASSDQSWLTISVEDFSGNYNFQNLLAGSNDAKIILKAQTNSSGQTRSANINLSGDQGVNAKTVIVSQTFILATGEAKTVFTTLYPNPTSDILNIETDQKISKIEVYDVSGKLAISTNGKDKKVTVSNLNNGMYFIKLYTENGVINSKFIKK